MQHYGYAYVLLVVASLVASLGQVLMRWGGRHGASVQTSSSLEWMWTSRWWLVGLFIGWFSGLVWALTLRKMPLSMCMPLYTGLVYITSIGLSFVLLREGLAPLQTFGALLILGGLILVVVPGQ